MTEFPNWFQRVAAPIYFTEHLKHLQGQELQFLQIGAFTGDATEWMINNILTHPNAILTDVDTWGGSDEREHEGINFSEVEEYYDARHAESIEIERLLKFKMTSDEFFATKVGDKKYDFIYVDGDHKADAVLRDGINAIKHLKPGGIIAFDDYLWSLNKGPAFDPKPAIEAIAICHSDRFDIIDTRYQLWMKENI